MLTRLFAFVLALGSLGASSGDFGSILSNSNLPMFKFGAGKTTLPPEKIITGHCEVQSTESGDTCTGVMIQLQNFSTGEPLAQVRIDGTGNFWFQPPHGQKYQLAIVHSRYESKFSGEAPYPPGSSVQVVLTAKKK